MNPINRNIRKDRGKENRKRRKRRWGSGGRRGGYREGR